MAQRLTTDAGRNALAALLAVSGSKAAIVGELDAILEGARGPANCATTAELDVALSDYVSNGMSSGQWNAQHFRACVRRAKQGIPPSSNGNGNGTHRVGGVAARTFRNAQEVLRDIPRVIPND